MNKNLRLTKQTAKALVKHALGISTTSLETEKACDGVYIYNMSMGLFTVKVENDWYQCNGLYVITIRLPLGQSIRTYYNPDDFDVDYAATDKWLAETIKEGF